MEALTLTGLTNLGGGIRQRGDEIGHDASLSRAGQGLCCRVSHTRWRASVDSTLVHKTPPPDVRPHSLDRQQIEFYECSATAPQVEARCSDRW